MHVELSAWLSRLCPVGCHAQRRVQPPLRCRAHGGLSGTDVCSLSWLYGLLGDAWRDWLDPRPAPK